MVTRRSLRVLALGMLMCATIAVGHASAASAKTVWLCNPGHQPDPCATNLSTTVYNAPLTAPLRVEHPKPQSAPPIDCFYVYPTVSDETTGNSDLKIQDTERSIAEYQVSRYSQYCKVYAPMYRQVTLKGAGIDPSGGSSTKPDTSLGVEDVTAAFKDYLAHDNHGRGFVFIGHSQGSAVLEQVIAKQVDSVPALRKQMLSAILMGGNVLVKGNSGIGGTFQHIPACRHNTQLGCVVAFSTFDQPVPNPSLFGRPTALLGSKPPQPGDHVLCTNPANLAGGSGLLNPIQPSAPFAPGSTIALGLSVLNYTVPAPSTTYWSQTGAYSAQCENSNGAHVLEITARNGAQTPAPAPTPEWGLHLLDANLSQGNLLSIIHDESRAFMK
jgi:Protein of unknown function (DUF3089)